MTISKFQLFLITFLWLALSIASFYLGYQKGKYDIELSKVTNLIEHAPPEIKGKISDLINDWKGLNDKK